MDLVKAIRTAEPFYSENVIPVIRVPDTGIAIKYLNRRVYGNRGFDMYSRHLRASLLDDFFVSNGGYARKHVTAPMGYFEIAEERGFYTGYLYPFTEGEVKFDTEYEGLPRRIDEWASFQALMKEAGFEFSSRNFNKGGWAGGGVNFDDIIYFGSRRDEHFTNEWVIIDFCQEHTGFSRQTFEEFVEAKKKELQHVLGDRFKELVDP